MPLSTKSGDRQRTTEIIEEEEPGDNSAIVQTKEPQIDVQNIYYRFSIFAQQRQLERDDFIVVSAYPFVTQD